MACVEREKSSQKEKNLFFHGAKFQAKVSFFTFVRSKQLFFMKGNRLQWFKTEEREGRNFVFDPLRKRFVLLTPEEEVRQKVLYLLVEHLTVPAGLIAVEYSLKVNGLDKRADAVVFGAQGHPIMIVECKAATVPLTQAVLEQAVRYHSALRPRYLLLTNGTVTYCYQVEGQSMSPLDHLPDYREMRGEAHE